MNTDIQESDDADRRVPVRMVNEHVYCPRLFWLEHVAGVFEDNEHTVEGQTAHARVNRPGGHLSPPPDSPDEEPWHARSLWLSSDELGVSGKLDFVDEVDGVVMPVDTKKGRAPPSGGLWPSDEIQLALQGLLLRASGYRCEKVACFYKAEQRRVAIDLTDELERRARAAVEATRVTSERTDPPPPLVDSPKCPGCSLNAVCQPDETNALTGRTFADEDHPLRLVLPASEDAVPVNIVSPGARVGVRGTRLHVQPPERSGEKPVDVGLGQVSQVNIFGTAQMTTQALRTCMEAGIPVQFFSTGGWFYGLASGHASRQVQVRKAQFASVGTTTALGIARVLIADKIANARTLLRRHAADGAHEPDLLRLQRLIDEAGEAEDMPLLLAREGEAAKRHWGVFSELVSRDDPRFAMTGRTRRPPRDFTNALVSFAAGMLVKECTLAVRAAGLDPYMGLYHTAHHGRPSLALDLMEPFRPLVIDSVVLSVIRRGEVTADGFVRTGPAVAMREPTRRALISAWERRMSEHVTHPLFGYRITYRQVLSVQARLLSRVLTGEIEAMPSFRTR